MARLTLRLLLSFLEFIEEGIPVVFANLLLHDIVHLSSNVNLLVTTGVVAEHAVVAPVEGLAEPRQLLVVGR